MELMVLVGVWALAFGHLSLSNSGKMKGNEARLFGALVIIAAAYGYPHVTGFLGRYLPEQLAGVEAFRSAWGLLIGALCIHITNVAFHTVYPKFRIPTVNVSFKGKARRAA